MHSLPKPRYQTLTIIAQDPGVRTRSGGTQKIVRANVQIPAEHLKAGPWGYRVQVVDFDASSNSLWPPQPYAMDDGLHKDPFAKATDKQLLSDPQFHQQNVYAIVMRILARFELALGRRVSWSFGGHQLKVVPHAFADANAFYSKEDEALLFGYFADPKYLKKNKRPKPGSGIVFTCLSHDVVAHETTHALVDGLRKRYTEPSSPDQAAFHEGISDVVALLSVFALKEVMVELLGNRKSYTPDDLRQSALFRMAEQMGSAVSEVRGAALRRSTELEPGTDWRALPEFDEPHRRGEILVAAMLNALIHIWAARIDGLRQDPDGRFDISRVVEEGQRAADYLLTMSIRALDYCPPVHLSFSDYLSALLTADREIRPDDSVFQFRKHLLASFKSYDIEPAAKGTADAPGIWCNPEQELPKGEHLSYDRTHFAPMQHDRDEVFRFVWENRGQLRLSEEAYTEVQSVRPCLRISDDGFPLRETVAEYVQILRLMPADLKRLGVRLPKASLLPADVEVFLHGGGTLVFDEYGRLKFHIHNLLQDDNGRITRRQVERLHYLAGRGYYLQQPRASRSTPSRLRMFGQMHLNRGLNRDLNPAEGWVDDDDAPAAHHHGHVHGPAEEDDGDID